MRKLPLVFWVDGLLPPAEAFAEDYPLRQTQALLLTLSELSAWLDQARMSFGGARIPSLDTHHDWFDMVENLVDDVWAAVEDEQDHDVISCHLAADDLLIEELDTVLDNLPSPDDILENLRSEALGDVLRSLTSFWVEQLRLRLVRLQSQLMGDGEVLAVLNRQEALAQLSF